MIAATVRQSASRQNQTEPCRGEARRFKFLPRVRRATCDVGYLTSAWHNYAVCCKHKHNVRRTGQSSSFVASPAASFLQLAVRAVNHIELFCGLCFSRLSRAWSRQRVRKTHGTQAVPQKWQTRNRKSGPSRQPSYSQRPSLLEPVLLAAIAQCTPTSGRQLCYLAY